MDEEGDWRVILTSLDELKKRLSREFKSEGATLREEVNNVIAPSVDYLYFVDRVDALVGLLNSRTELSLKKRAREHHCLFCKNR